MDEHPALALREKKDASILVATDLVRRGEAEAVVTAGHTGAGMAAAVLRLGRLKGVDRPALAVQMVTDTGPFVFLDIGANPDSTGREPPSVRPHGRDLRGASARVWRDPRVALLSIGEEKGQGRRLASSAGDRAARGLGPELHRQHRGQGPGPTIWPMWS